MPREESFGFVIVHRAKGADRYLLVRQLTHWSFPKGHAEKKETPLEAARRELFEECGLSFISIAPDVSFSEEYVFIRNGVETEKKNTFFLAETSSEEIHPQPIEILECRFAPYEEARALLTFESQKRVLDEVKNRLSS